MQNKGLSLYNMYIEWTSDHMPQSQIWTKTFRKLLLQVSFNI